MYPCFDVEGISAERLLHEWKWLVDGTFRLVAVNAFGDLFLSDAQGRVCWLDVTNGTASEITDSVTEFTAAMKNDEFKKRCFLEALTRQAEPEGFRPGKGQCIGYKIPCIFRERAQTWQRILMEQTSTSMSLLWATYSVRLRSFLTVARFALEVEPHTDEKNR